MGVSYTVFHGRAGDHNDLAMPAAKRLGDTFQEITGISPVVIGTPKPSLSTDWSIELKEALPELKLVQERFDEVFKIGDKSIAATSRCAVSLATLPVVAKYHPDVCIVWFDSHADLNTPEVTTTGYLGGLAFAGPIGMWESGLGDGLKLSQIILVGQRDLDPFEVALIEENNIPHIKPNSDFKNELEKAIAGRAVYVHLDCDVLEPGIVPTDYVHDGGLTLADLKLCSEVIASHQFVGIEIAELQNSWTHDSEPVDFSPLLDALSPLLNAK